MRIVAFTPEAFREYNEWFDGNKLIVDKIKTLVREIDRDPFKGIGKPEPLRAIGVAIGVVELTMNTDWFIVLPKPKY